MRPVQQSQYFSIVSVGWCVPLSQREESQRWFCPFFSFHAEGQREANGAVVVITIVLASPLELVRIDLHGTN